MPAACRSRNGVGGVLVTNVNDRSSKIEISAGITMPRWLSVAALYALQKSMMLMPCGPSAVPTGGAGVAWPAGIWIFTIAASFFFAIFPSLSLCTAGVPAARSFVRGRAPPLAPLGAGAACAGPRCLQLGHLAQFELDGGLAAEDVHQHGELRAGDVDVGDHAVEVGERTGGDPHLLAHLEVEARPRLLLGADLDGLAGAEDVLDLLARERRGPGAVADEPGDTRRVAHDVPGVVVEGHAHQQVAGEHLLLHDDLAAALELDDVLHRNDDLEDLLLDVHRAHPAGQVLLDLVLVARVGVHDEPVARSLVGARIARGALLLVVVE